MGYGTGAAAKRQPTMSDVARAAGVSPATVSYVISGQRSNGQASRISDDTRRRVRDAMREIGYTVNESARSLRRNRTDRVLLIVDRLASPYSQRMASEIEMVLEGTGRSLSIMVCATAERLEAALGSIPRRLADGAIVDSRAIPGIQGILERFAQKHVPLVAINTTLEPRGFDILANDEAPAIYEAIDHLVARGHRRIGFLAHTLDDPPLEPRLPIVRQRLADHGLSLDADAVIVGARDRISAFTAVQSLLAGPNRPSALFSASDIGAISALWAARSRGIHVPDELAVIGTGNIDEATITTPSLSSLGPVKPDFAVSARMLIERLDATAPVDGRRLSIPWRFVPRQSS